MPSELSHTFPFQSPSMFASMHRRESPELSDESDEDEESSDDDDEEGFGRPISVHDIRKEMRPGTANSPKKGPITSNERPGAFLRHTVM